MSIRDDFLIIGFTGPFCSGCSTSAKFFTTELNDKKLSFTTKKDDNNSAIINWYRDLKKRKHKNDGSKLKNELLELVRTRQHIQSLGKVPDFNFFYISMTTILNHCIIRDALDENIVLNNMTTEQSDFIKSIRKEATRFDISRERVNKIELLLNSKSEPALAIDYFKTVEDFRGEIGKSFVNNLSLFQTMQSIGNNLRKFGTAFPNDASLPAIGSEEILSKIACQYLKAVRKHKKTTSTEDHRTYFVIECFRNPAEINYFRKRFSEFYLFSVFRNETLRIKSANILYKLKKEDTETIDKTDQGNDYIEELHKQSIKECVNLADIAITNNSTIEDLRLKLLQYFSLIKSPGCVLPTHEERNMHLAYSASLNSACICRQVGAVITKDGYIIGLGWNDAESYNIGCLFRHKRDARDIGQDDFPLGYEDLHTKIVDLMNINLATEDHSFCLKDEYANYKKNIPAERIEDETAKKILEKVKTKSLQECRSLHAEENAILQVAKSGTGNLNGATLYTTTFPCELCTKKILQVGIR